jgi:hypothetical protein
MQSYSKVELVVFPALVALSYLIFPLYAMGYKAQYGRNANVEDVPVFGVAFVLFMLTLAAMWWLQ